jgi:hypothetical protein
MAGHLKFETRIGRSTKFQPIIFDAETMKNIGTSVMESIKKRIMTGLDISDLPAKPLAKSYHKFKTEKLHLPGIRDWKLTGVTLAHMHVLWAAPNQATIGFNVGTTSSPTLRRGFAGAKGGQKIVAISLVVGVNQRRCRQFGMSPINMRTFEQAIQSRAVLLARPRQLTAGIGKGTL